MIFRDPFIIQNIVFWNTQKFRIEECFRGKVIFYFFLYRDNIIDRLLNHFFRILDKEVFSFAAHHKIFFIIQTEGKLAAVYFFRHFNAALKEIGNIRRADAENFAIRRYHIT